MRENDWLIDWLLFGVPFENISCFRRWMYYKFLFVYLFGYFVPLENISLIWGNTNFNESSNSENVHVRPRICSPHTTSKVYWGPFLPRIFPRNDPIWNEMLVISVLNTVFAITLQMLAWPCCVRYTEWRSPLWRG